MRQTELHLSAEDRDWLESYRSKGVRHAREVTRAHILCALDRGVSESEIMAVLHVGRTTLWRTRSAYLEGGVEYAVHDMDRPGKPRQYGTEAEARITALACSAPPQGSRRWTLALLEEILHAQGEVGLISRETIRRRLKKTTSSRGAGRCGASGN